jgi:hypothetical protein
LIPSPHSANPGIAGYRRSITTTAAYYPSIYHCTFLPSLGLAYRLVMPLQERPRAYPLIDADPHAGRVIRYMRSSDYLVWGGATAAGPALLFLYGESAGWAGIWLVPTEGLDDLNWRRKEDVVECGGEERSVDTFEFAR